MTELIVSCPQIDYRLMPVLAIVSHHTRQAGEQTLTSSIALPGGLFGSWQYVCGVEQTLEDGPDSRDSGNARLAGLEADLNMTEGDYALALSLFFVSYNLCEVVCERLTRSFPCLSNPSQPANLMLKRLSPKIWLSSIVFAFGIVVGMDMHVSIDADGLRR